MRMYSTKKEKKQRHDTRIKGKFVYWVFRTPKVDETSHLPLSGFVRRRREFERWGQKMLKDVQFRKPSQSTAAE